MDRCSPNYADQTISCFTKDALLKIIRTYNKNHMDPIKVNNKDNKSDIWEAIQMKMNDRCGEDEACWLEQGFLKKMPEFDQYFKPLAPLGQYQWLSTDDIFNVMTQYDQKYDDFKFVGPLPMDFLNLSDPDSKYLQNLNVNREKQKGYKTIGVIFNMDPSTKGGSHWIAMNIDLRKGEIQFFDSYGDKKGYQNKFKLPYHDSYGTYHRDGVISMPPQIQKFVFQIMKRITPKNAFSGGAGRKKGVKMPYNLRINTIQHQFANSECGIYSMLFVLKSRNMPFERITQDIITDEVANRERRNLFRRK